MTPKNCEEARALLLDHQRGRLAPDDSRALETHLASCPACARAAEEERALSQLLQTRLPQRAAPAALVERLASELASAEAAASLPRVRAARASTPRRSVPLLFAALATAAALGFAAMLWPRGLPARDAFAREAVNDHLRVLFATQPIEIASGGIHQVKPWFTGRLDFAPDVAFSGNDDFPLLGGAVGYFVDRKASTFLFKRRLHSISLFVFRANGLLDDASSTPRASELAGFHLLAWRSHDLAHVLVSDVSAGELVRLQRLLADTK